jgi:hypothetical protein
VSREAHGDTHGRLDDAADVGLAGVEDGLEVGECLFCLWDDAAGDDLCGGGDERDAAGDEDEVAGLDRLGVGPDGGGGGCRGSATARARVGERTLRGDGRECAVCDRRHRAREKHAAHVLPTPTQTAQTRPSHARLVQEWRLSRPHGPLRRPYAAPFCPASSTNDSQCRPG